MTDPTLQDLRAAMTAHTATLLAPPELAATARASVSRRRTGNAVAAAAAAVVIAITSVVTLVSVSANHHQGEPGGKPTTIESPTAPTASPSQTSTQTTGGIGVATPASNEATWPYRGTLFVESIGDIDTTAYNGWAAKHGYQPAEVLGIPLLGVSTPSGKVLLFDISKLNSNTGSLAAFVQDAAGARIAYDTPAAPTSSGLAVRIQIGGTAYIVAVAAPGYSIADALPEGQAASPVSALPGARTGAGWATFPDPPNSVQSIHLAKCQDGTCTGAITVAVQ